MIPLMRRWCVLLAVLSLAGIAVGCGGGSDTTQTTTGATGADKPAPAEADVSEAQIRRAPKNGPERTVLEWWRDVQVNDPEHARRLYVEPPRLPDLAGQFNFVGDRMDGSVKVISSEEAGRQARVGVRWETPQGRDRRIVLRLGNENGSWKLLDARFLDEMVAQLQRDDSGD